MRPRLGPDGTMPPPESIKAAYERLGRLDTEIEEIRTQLKNEARKRLDATFVSYLEWRAAAIHKLEIFKNERAQLLAWIDAEYWQLFKDVVALVRDIDKDDGLFQEERYLLEKSEAAIKAREKR